MGFHTGQAGIDEARLIALSDLLKANLASLNAMLTRDGLWTRGSITSDMVVKGDPTKLPAVSEAPLMLCVVGGGRYDELDMEMDYAFIDQTDNSGFRLQIYTNILVYLHPDAVAEDATTWAAIKQQAEHQETVRARVCDWARKGVLNARANISIALTSQEFNASPAFDALDRCHVSKIYKGHFDKSFGGSERVYGAHIVHLGRVQ